MICLCNKTFPIDVKFNEVIICCIKDPGKNLVTQMNIKQISHLKFCIQGTLIIGAFVHL